MIASPEPQTADRVQPFQVEYDVPVAMRDGTILRANVYRPQAAGQYPVLVLRVGYELISTQSAVAEWFANRGYVFVAQNCRGRFASEGEFRFGLDDGWGANRDGYDTVEWAAVQPWSNGQVGTVGGSYAGFTQYLLGPTRPPHLKAQFVRQGEANFHWALFPGGAFKLSLYELVLRGLVLAPLMHPTAPAGSEKVRARLEAAYGDLQFWLRHLPLLDNPLSGVAEWYQDFLRHPDYGPFWMPLDPVAETHEYNTPAFHITGWYDLALHHAIGMFTGIQAAGLTAACREAQRLVIGPWNHGPAPNGVWQRKVGELDFGPAAAEDGMNEQALRWFDYWLRDEPTGIMDGPTVRLFVMGANRWLDAPSWPPPGIDYRPMFFHEGPGRSATSLNQGGLSFEAPADAERPDSYAYDPMDPVPSIALYTHQGPWDHQQVEARMLTYTSAPLEQPLIIAGPVKAILHAMSSAPDTDWVVRLCDVYPDGRSIPCCSGILRARYRRSLEREELLTPDQVERFEVDLVGTAQQFAAGHRVRVQVTSSDFPQYDRNLNTGGPFAEEAHGQVAVNTIFHDALRASHILLPVLP